MYRGLVGGLDDEFVDVHMRRTAGNPHNDLRDVVGGQRVHAFVNLLRARIVALEAYVGNLGLREARVDGADADAGAVEFEPQRAGDLQLAGLRGAIRRAAFVSSVTGNRTNVDDARAGIV